MKEFSQSFQPNQAPVSTAWELFLANEGIPESACRSLLNRRTEEGCAIRSWVLANYRTRFVPELVIQTLGLQHRHHLAG
jgi:hypothetical protein